MKDRVAVIAFVLGVLVGGAAVAVVLRGGATVQKDPGALPGGVPARDSSTRSPRDARANVIPQVEIAQDHWQKNGFIELVPPVYLPSSKDGSDQIRIWLKVPDGGVITTAKGPDGPTLDFPPGTIADRVESIGPVVTDVRGSLLTAGGELFHVYVPRAHTPTARLVGWEWPRGDSDRAAAATDVLLAFLRTAPLGPGAVDPGRSREKRLTDYRRNNDCARCHATNKPEQLQKTAMIHRGTDAEGWFVPQSLLSDEGPIERHRPADPNVDDRFITARCAVGAPRVDDAERGKRYRCDNGDAVVARYDLAAALKAGDARAQAVCAGRRYLHAHMSADARAQFQAAWRGCNIP